VRRSRIELIYTLRAQLSINPMAQLETPPVFQAHHLCHLLFDPCCMTHFCCCLRALAKGGLAVGLTADDLGRLCGHSADTPRPCPQIRRVDRQTQWGRQGRGDCREGGQPDVRGLLLCSSLVLTVFHILFLGWICDLSAVFREFFGTAAGSRGIT